METSPRCKLKGRQSKGKRVGFLLRPCYALPHLTFREPGDGAQSGRVALPRNPLGNDHVVYATTMFDAAESSCD